MGAALATIVDGGVLTTTAGPARTGRTPDPIGRFQGTIGGRPISVTLEWQMRVDRIRFLHFDVPIAEQPFAMRLGPDAPALGLPPATTADGSFDGRIRMHATNPEVLRFFLDNETRASILQSLDRDSFVESGPHALVYKWAVDDVTRVDRETMRSLCVFTMALADRIVIAFQSEVQRVARMGGPAAVSGWLAAQHAARNAAIEQRRARARKILAWIAVVMVVVLAGTVAALLSVVH